MEPIKNAVSITVNEETQIAAARRAAADMCRRLNLSDDSIARAELIAVELAGNMLHHAGSGDLYVGPAALGDGVQMIAADKGPGLGDVARAMQDGFSTRSTPGLGLGSVKRQATLMDAYSHRGEGTVVSILIRDTSSPQPFEVSVLSVPIEGETANGDCWAIYCPPGRVVYLMADGLGHGSAASLASSAALHVAARAFASDPHISLASVLQRMHLPLQATRGAAVLLVSVTPTASGSKLLCCGIGNISGVIVAPDSATRAMVSHNGTVGHRMARVQEFEYLAAPGSLLILHSDGISTRWKFSQYPGLIDHAPATIGAMLYRDGVRQRDDASILVAQLSSPAGETLG